MIKPLKDYILLEKIETKTTTKSGIVLPQTSKEEKNIAIVLEVGNGKILSNGERVKPEVKKGDKVLYSKYAGTELEYENKKYIIVREDELIATII